MTAIEVAQRRRTATTMRATATSLDETVWTQRAVLGDELVSRFCRCRGAVVAAIVEVEGVLERIVLATNEGRAYDDEYITLAQAWTGTERALHDLTETIRVVTGVMTAATTMLALMTPNQRGRGIEL